MSEIACGVWHSEFEMYCWRCQRDSRLAGEARIAELEQERDEARKALLWYVDETRRLVPAEFQETVLAADRAEIAARAAGEENKG